MKKYIVMAIIAIGFGCTPSFAQDQHHDRDNRGQNNGGDHRDSHHSMHRQPVRHHSSSRSRHSSGHQGGDNRQRSGEHQNDGRKY